MCIILLLLMALAAGNHIEPYKSDPYIACSAETKCPERWPCCSQFGQCGTGPLCVGGCDPRYSFSVESCAVIPALLPVKDVAYKMLDESLDNDWTVESFGAPALNTHFEIKNSELVEKMSPSTEKDLKGRGLVHFTEFMIGSDPSQATELLETYDFTYSGFVSVYKESSGIILGMPKFTTGSLISSAKSFLYGKASVTLKTARGPGVVSAMVLMSAVKDEIDFEFLGGELNSAQTNYYHQGELDHTKMRSYPLKLNTFQHYHDYEIDWNEERIHWLIDGSVVRTLYKKDTFDPELKMYKYPQTPMRLEIAVWPGGLESNNPGTIIWAGGLVDWDNSPDILESGQFYSSVSHIKITPYANDQSKLMVPYVGNEYSAMSKGPHTQRHGAFFYDADCDTFDESCVKLSSESLLLLPSWESSGLNSGVPKSRIKEKLPFSSIDSESNSATINLDIRDFSNKQKFIQDIRKLPIIANGTFAHTTPSSGYQYDFVAEENKAARSSCLNMLSRIISWFLY